jgi:hypothetical protein
MNGFELTFGEYLKQLDPTIDNANWMKEKKFGGIDRKQQIINALDKIFLEYR